jgi:hypothetical protein
MDEKMGLPNHVTKRGATYQYVRRIPDDIAPAFGVSRIQRSLRTGDKAKAFSEAAKVNDAVEQQFAEARAKLGIVVELQDVSDWPAADWDEVARWFEARLIQDDLERRLPKLKGGALAGDPGRQEHGSVARKTLGRISGRPLPAQRLPVCLRKRLPTADRWSCLPGRAWGGHHPIAGRKRMAHNGNWIALLFLRHR